MSDPKAGLMTFGDAREHEWNNLFRGLTEPRHKSIIEYFQNLPVELCYFEAVARTKDQIDTQIDELKALGVEALIVHLPCWTSPNLVVRGVQRMGLPTILVSNKHPGTHGTVGLLGAGGALDQIGYPPWFRTNILEPMVQSVCSALAVRWTRLDIRICASEATSRVKPSLNERYPSYEPPLRSPV